jgi:hypothetical protein
MACSTIAHSVGVYNANAKAYQKDAVVKGADEALRRRQAHLIDKLTSSSQ